MDLPEPIFINTDPQAVTDDLIALYQQMTGKVLQPAQPERLFIDLVAYRETLLRIGIQQAAEQNLVDYASFPILDYLGAFLTCPRLDAQAAITTITFTLEAVQAAGVTIPAGTEVQTNDGNWTFATNADAVVPAGLTSVDVPATATATGSGANGYLPGAINNLLDSVTYVQGASNSAVSYGGTDEETDDAYRERVKEAPEKLSVAGPTGAYSYWAKTADASIIDVSVITPSAGVVNVYVLTDDGSPSAAILAAVTTILSADDVRPLTDNVQVLAPTEESFQITAALVLYSWAVPDTVLTQVNAALNTYVAALKSKLGMDIVVDQINGIISGVYGVYKPGVTAPAADQVLDDTQWANCSAINVTIASTVDG